MEIIEGTALSNMCDYSFGDQVGVLEPSYVKGAFMKDANEFNLEFVRKAREFEGRIMTLFIDNIRLYSRPVKADNPTDQVWIDHLTGQNDLLRLCSLLSKNTFVIFTSHEDTPIDDRIKLPPNVLYVHAVNALYNNERIVPFPYGVQRVLGKDDNRISILKDSINESVEPQKLLYINCGVGRNQERLPLRDFEGLPYVTTRFHDDSKFFPYDRYHDFLDDLRNHKFVICPKGHGFDCHRNWETLYMRRVPVMIRHPYFERLMSGFPMLFVDDWLDVNEEFLVKHEDLYQQAQNMSMDSLDLSKVYVKRAYG